MTWSCFCWMNFIWTLAQPWDLSPPESPFNVGIFSGIALGGNFLVQSSHISRSYHRSPPKQTDRSSVLLWPLTFFTGLLLTWHLDRRKWRICFFWAVEANFQDQTVWQFFSSLAMFVRMKIKPKISQTHTLNHLHRGVSSVCVCVCVFSFII